MDSSLFFSNALMDMYAKCGSIKTKKFILNSSRTSLNIYGNCKVSHRNLRPCLDAHYPLTHHSSIITYHLKYPNFLKVARLAHCFQLLITQKIVLSVGTIPEHHVNKFCYPTRLTLISFHFLHCSFLLQPFSFVTLPKPETNPAKIEEAWT